jgi:hypothetical protein
MPYHFRVPGNSTGAAPLKAFKMLTDEITQEYLKSRLSYNPDTGVFTWLNGQKSGKIAGNLKRQGYIKINICLVYYAAHRLAWLYVYGRHPGEIDHINGIGSDNRICNLRECTSTQNNFNQRKRLDNSSGFRGVTWHKTNKKWRARIEISRKVILLGYFSTPELANAAYQSKARELHGEFYRAPEAG